jgi:hypothetical protein
MDDTRWRTRGMRVYLDQFTDGEPCWVAEDEALPGAFGYGLTRADAERHLDEIRLIREGRRNR